MCTSDTDQMLRRLAKTSLVYLLIACFCALFGGVYEYFSHGVYSYPMLYAFAYPLLGGALPFLLLGLSRCKNEPAAPETTIYHCGIATLTLGSIISGVLEIYGTTNFLTICYPYAGWLLVGIGFGVWFIGTVFPKKRR